MALKAYLRSGAAALVCACFLLCGWSGAAAADDTVSRGAFVQALYQAHIKNGGAAVESAGNPDPFTDVGEWSVYFEALCWAKGGGIAGGYQGGAFRPELPVTREQAAVMLWRYEKAMDRTLQPASARALDGYQDAAQVPAWSLEAVRWAVGNGLWYSGSASLLRRSGAVTGEELTVLMERLFKGGMEPAASLQATAPEGLVMELQSFTAAGASLTLQNRTDLPFTFSAELPALYRQVNGGWYRMYAGTASTGSVSHELPAGGTRAILADWSRESWGGTLSPGRYCLSKSGALGGENVILTAEFSVQ